jgi:aldehyde:ferredoxin oxidoreductase
MNAFPYGGFAGWYLSVDLSTGAIERHPLPPSWVEEDLGGNGIGARLLWERVPPAVNPLDPRNCLIVATGPLCGSPMPNCGRVEFVAKSPLTGAYGDSNAGGHFGPELKFAGFDLLVLTGRAPEPVYLWIRDGRAELRSAAHLAGMGAGETERRLQADHGDAQIKVACIGPAGENLVRYAGIQVTYRRSAGRSGVGAVMGSKNLKAIAVRGTGGLRFADPAGLERFSTQMHARVNHSEFAPGARAFGTPGLVAIVQPMGRFPTLNFRQGNFEGFESITGEALREEHLVHDMACYTCPLGCDKVYAVSGGPYAGVNTSSVEYETLNSLGARIGNRDLPAVLRGNELCDEWGLDTISAGSAVAFAMELAEKGILTPAECEGLDLRWGCMATALELLRRITYREGFLGDLLAEGTARAAHWLGRDAERYAMHVKGQDIPAQDGRAQQSMGLAHATSVRGADHLKAFPVIDETGYPAEAERRYGAQYLPEIAQPLEVRYKAMLVKDGEDFAAVVDSSGNCKSGGTFVLAEIYWPEQAEAIRLATGLPIDADRLRRFGERIVNRQRSYNALHGLDRSDDALPWRITQAPSPSGNARGSVCRLDEMLGDYYRLRGWDPENGLPLAETLERLGLKGAFERIREAWRSGTARACRAQLGWTRPYAGPPPDAQ